jgi:hypothetical protein
MVLLIGFFEKAEDKLCLYRLHHGFRTTTPLFTTAFSMTVYRDVESFRVPTLVGVLFISLVAILFAAGLYFWLGMLFFLLKFDRRSVISKCALFPLLLLGTTLTATIYYFLVYREIARRADHSSPAL